MMRSMPSSSASESSMNAERIVDDAVDVIDDRGRERSPPRSGPWMTESESSMTEVSTFLPKSGRALRSSRASMRRGFSRWVQV
jgi:hypothetical protein